MEGGKKDSRENASIFLCVVFVVAFLMGYGTLILLGLSSVHGERTWSENPITIFYNSGGLREGDLEVNHNQLYRLGTDFVANREIRWLFRGRITLYGSDQYTERDFWLYFQNVSNGYFSDRVLVSYGSDLDFGNASIVVDEIIKFYRPGEYVLRVVNRLQGSEVNFTSYGRVLVADELVGVIEDFKNEVVGSLMIISGLLMILLMSSAWDRLGLVDYWAEANQEWKLFWRSWHSDLLILLWMLVAFDLLTTYVGLSHGAWESNDMARKDMYGTIWLTVLFFLGFSFLAFFLRGEGGKVWKRVDIWLLTFFALYAGSPRVYAITNNLEVLSVLAGLEAFWITSGIILCVTLLFSLFFARRLIQRRRGRGNQKMGMDESPKANRE